ncbi:MAG: hypothetical protein Q9197_006345 [Variospora fuerteventurae]
MSLQLPSPPSSTSSGSRSRVQNSSEEGSDLVIFANTATRSYTAERFRLGIPALQILPLLSLPLPSNSPVVQRINVIEPRIEEILENRSISSEDREVVYRTLPGQTPSEFDITYVVRAMWRGDEDAQGWYSAAEEIRALFITHYSPSKGAALVDVFKIGARTGATTGNFSHIKSQVKMAWDKEYNLPVSTEFCFIADPVTLAQPFMCQGDSGSWLFTQTGKWAGTGFGGPVKAGITTQAIGYVTDAQAILGWLRSIGFEARLSTF